MRIDYRGDVLSIDHIGPILTPVPHLPPPTPCPCVIWCHTPLFHCWTKRVRTGFMKWFTSVVISEVAGWGLGTTQTWCWKYNMLFFFLHSNISWYVLGCGGIWPLLWPFEWHWGGQLWQLRWWRGWCVGMSKQSGLILVRGRPRTYNPMPCTGESIQSRLEENPDLSGREWEEGAGGPTGWHCGYFWWDQP